MSDRFEFKKPQRDGLMTDALIIVDTKTGVNYLMVRSGYGAGLTPLIDAEGKPIVTKYIGIYGSTDGPDVELSKKITASLLCSHRNSSFQTIFICAEQ